MFGSLSNQLSATRKEFTMLKLGLCCIFREEPIKFRTTTAKFLSGLSSEGRKRKLAELCHANAAALAAAIDYCASHGIGCFRVNSQILPLKTHPDMGYELRQLPGGSEIIDRLQNAGATASRRGIRLSMHPDQFVVLNSPIPKVVANSLAELEYQNEFAEWTGVDVINIHGGGVYGNKGAALGRFTENFARLSAGARGRLTVENDDRTYTPADLLPLCCQLGIPLVYDVHHHRCLPDGLTVEEATCHARETWHGRVPLFHLSSPREGWSSPSPQFHHDYVDVADIPACWLSADQNLTVEVEAKAKELAIRKLLADLAAMK